MTTYSLQQSKFVLIFAGLMVLGALCFFGYRVADGAFLAETEAVAKVTGKEHIPFSEQYRMQNIGGVNRTVKIAVPETWLLTVDLGGASAQSGVSFPEFQAIVPGDDVRIKYKKRRISSNLQVTQFLGKAGG